MNKEKRRKQKIAVSAKWQKKHTVLLSGRFNLVKDRDVIEHIAKQPNKTDYLRKLVRADIARER